MKTLVALVVPGLVLAACGGGQSSLDALRGSMPNSDSVALKVPGGSGQALDSTGQNQQGLQGATSEFYLITRVTTVWVNVSTALVLGLFDAIVANPPTSFDGHVAVWGPWTDALSPNTYRFTARDEGNHHFSYMLEGKAKTAPDSAYVTIASGSGVATVDGSGHPIRGYGSGMFTLDWSAAATLPEHDDNVGQATFTYSRVRATSDTQIDVAFVQVRDRGPAGGLINANYHYVQHFQADGDFSFATSRANHAGATLPPELASIHSRWKNTGAGRADVQLTGQSAPPTNFTVNECWNSNFQSEFLLVSWDPNGGYGIEQQDCAFIGAQYVSQ